MKNLIKRANDLKFQIELWKRSTINYGDPFGKYHRRINYYTAQYQTALKRIK